MNHAQIRQQLALYRELGDKTRAQVDAHTRECADCAARLRDYQAMDRELAAMPLPRPGAHVRQRFYETIQGEAVMARGTSTSGISFKQFSNVLGQLAGVATILLLIFALWWVYQTLNNGNLPAGGPTPIAPTSPVLIWTRGQDADCRAISIDAQGGAEYGNCSGPNRKGLILSDMGRPYELTYFVERYQSFEADTVVGHLKFMGQGKQAASPAEQRAVGEWAALVYQELDMGRSGASSGLALVVIREGANPCSLIEIELYGKTVANDCGNGLKPPPARWLDASQLQVMYGWLDKFAGLEMDFLKEGDTTLRLVLSGTGKQQATDTDREEMIGWMDGRLQEIAAPNSPTSAGNPNTPALMTPTPVPTPAVSLGASIPLQQGNTWVYEVTSYNGPNASEIVTNTFPLTLTVTDVKTDASSYAAKIHGDKMDYWLIVKDNRIYKQWNGPDLSNLTDSDSLELFFPYKPDDKWILLPASLPDHPATGGITRQVLQIGSVQVPAGHFDNCALFHDGWNTDTVLNWWCPGVGWVDLKDDHNGTPFGEHRILQKFVRAGSNDGTNAARTVVDQFMQARIKRDEQAVMDLLSDKLRSNINSVSAPLMQVSNPCWYRYEILSAEETGKDQAQARVRIYEHQWAGDNAGGPPRSWEQGITLIKTPSGWRVDGLTNAVNQRQETGEPHGSTQSACNAAPAPTLTPPPTRAPAPTATAYIDQQPISIVWSPDNKIVAVSTRQGITLYNPDTRAVVRMLNPGEYSESLAFSPDGARLACTCGEGAIKLWDVKSGKLLKTLLESEMYTSIAFSSDGKYLAGGTHDGSIKISDANGDKLIRSITGLNTSVPVLRFSADSREIVTGDGIGAVKVWSASSGQLVRTVEAHGYVIELSPDGTRAAGSDPAGSEVQVWNVVSGKPLGKMTGLQLGRFQFSPDGKTLVVHTLSQNDWYDAETGKRLGLLLPNDQNPSGVMGISWDGARVAMMAKDGQLIVENWQVAAVLPSASTEDQVWQTVKQAVGVSVSPILKPRGMPADFQEIQPANAVPGAFQVDYRGKGKSLSIIVSTLGLPPVSANGSSNQITVRGQTATLQQSGSKIWVTWREPGKWYQPETGETVDGVSYLLLATGMTSDEVIQIAAALTPLGDETSVQGKYVSFRVPSSWNPVQRPTSNGGTLEEWTPGIPGVESDQDIGFSVVPLANLKPNDVVSEKEITIGGKPGYKWVRKGEGYVSYDYYTT